MKVKQAISQILLAVKAGHPVLLMGPPGIGKTMIVRAIAAMLGLPYREIIASNYDGVDWRGIPHRDAATNQTKWDSIPDFLPTDACVLNFDEISQAPADATAPLLKLLLERSLGNYRLPDGVVLFATANHHTHGAGARRLTTALRDRFRPVVLEVDADAWLEWYDDADPNPIVREFITQNPAAIHSFDADLDYNQPSPRNWAALGQLLNVAETDQTAVDVETLSWYIGPTLAPTFYNFAKQYVPLPDVKRVVDGKSTPPTSQALLPRWAQSLATFVGETILGQRDSDDAQRDLARGVELIDELDGGLQVLVLKTIGSEYGRKALSAAPLKGLLKRHAAAITAR